MNTKIERLDTPEKLNKRASIMLNDIHQYAFGNLPGILDNIITNKAWESLPTQFNNFGEYALSHSVDGLCVNNNEKLWLLRCAIDFDGKHIQEWKDVLVMVSKMIKATPLKKRGKIPNRTISLEMLAKLPNGEKGITYYPSRSTGQDSDILNLSKKGFLSKIASGQLTRKEALIKAGLKRKNISYNRAKSAFNSLDKKQKTDFINWLRISSNL